MFHHIYDRSWSENVQFRVHPNTFQDMGVPTGPCQTTLASNGRRTICRRSKHRLMSRIGRLNATRGLGPHETPTSAAMSAMDYNIDMFEALRVVEMAEEILAEMIERAMEPPKRRVSRFSAFAEPPSPPRPTWPPPPPPPPRVCSCVCVPAHNSVSQAPLEETLRLLRRFRECEEEVRKRRLEDAIEASRNRRRR